MTGNLKDSDLKLKEVAAENKGLKIKLYQYRKMASKQNQYEEWEPKNSNMTYDNKMHSGYSSPKRDDKMLKTENSILENSAG